VPDRAATFDEHDLGPDPAAQFDRWYEDAQRATPQPDAVALATAAADGRPSVRMVLAKRASAAGFEFCTNYESRKGDDLAVNPFAALLFYWHALGRQVRIEGPVERLDAAASDAHYDARPVESRLSSAASPQSRVVRDRAELEAAVDALRPGPPARPGWWGCYRLVPELYEFRQHRDSRLHDRFRYRRDGSAWTVERLGP